MFQRPDCVRSFNLTVSQTGMIADVLTTRAARKSSSDGPGDGNPDRSDRVRHMTFRPDWGSRVVDNLWIREVLR
jgi:hypothetical protein